MKCKNCGNELQEGDVFCEKCGAKVEVAETKKVKKKLTNKQKIIGGVIAFVALFLAVAMIIPSEGKEEHFEANELAKIMYDEDEADKHAHSTISVHGLLYVSTFKVENGEIDNHDDNYSLYSKDNEDDVVVFSYKDGLEDLGNGSEVTVTGQLGKSEGGGSIILIADKVEVQKQEEIVYDVGTLDELAATKSQLMGKKIMVSGRLVDFLGQGHCIVDTDLEYRNELKGLTEKEFAQYFKNGSMAYVVGTYTDDKEIEVEKITQNDVSKELSQLIGVSVADAYRNYSVGDQVTIRGIYIRNGSASVPYSVTDENAGYFIQLTTSNESVDLDDYFESDSECIVSGYLYESGTGYILEVSSVG